MVEYRHVTNIGLISYTARTRAQVRALGPGVPFMYI